jgi:four helix bundle protein
MGKIVTFKDLKVWQKSHQLVLEIYQLTKVFPSEEKFGLSAQIRRAAISIPSNIAKGFKRKSKKDFAHFLNMADSSLEEVKYQLFLARDLRYFSEEAFNQKQAQCEEVGKMLFGLAKSLNC